MLLVSILLIPVVAAAVILMLASQRVATSVAVGAGTLEMVGLALTVWRVTAMGSLEGRFLRADTLTPFFLMNAGLVLCAAVFVPVQHHRRLSGQ